MPAANVLTNFLVGIGFDYDTDGQKKIESGINAIKSRALQLGAVVAGAFGIKVLTVDFAQANDQLGKFSQVLGVSAEEVSALGRSIELEGGTFSSFLSQLEGLEEMRAGLLAGNFDFGAAAAAGIDPQPIIDAVNATEAFINLADQFSKLSTQQRINAASALGLTPASIRLLSKGTDEVERLVQAQKDLRPVTAAMTQEAAEFNDNIQKMTNGIGQFADRISDGIIPPINDVLKGLNEWIKLNKDIVNSGIENVFDLPGEALVKGAALLSPGGAVTAGFDMAQDAFTDAFDPSKNQSSFLQGVFGGRGGSAGGASSMPQGFGDPTVPFSSVLPMVSTQDIVSGITGTRSGDSRSTPAPTLGPLNVTLNLDGKVLEQKIIEVNEIQNQITLDALSTSEGG